VNLDNRILAKISPSLKRALVHANAEDECRVLFLLSPLHEGKTEEKAMQPLKSGEFPDYVSYKRALIERRRYEAEVRQGDTIRALKQLKLNPKGGELGSVVVVEGSVEQLLKGLELPSVTKADIDQHISLSLPLQDTQPPKGTTIEGNHFSTGEIA
jgi:hypothetical protein